MNNCVIFFQNVPTPDILLGATFILTVAVYNGTTRNHGTIPWI